MRELSARQTLRGWKIGGDQILELPVSIRSIAGKAILLFPLAKP